MEKAIQEQVNSMIEFVKELDSHGDMVAVQVGKNIVEVTIANYPMDYETVDWFIDCFLDEECRRKRTNNAKGYTRYWMDDIIVQVKYKIFSDFASRLKAYYMV